MSHMRDEHLAFSDYLVRLARALCWSDCIDPPNPGNETHMLAESLLERAERTAIHTEHHDPCDKSCYDLPTPHHHHHHLPKLRRERSCHDIPLKEVRWSNMIWNFFLSNRILNFRAQPFTHSSERFAFCASKFSVVTCIWSCCGAKLRCSKTTRGEKLFCRPNATRRCVGRDATTSRTSERRTSWWRWRRNWRMWRRNSPMQPTTRWSDCAALTGGAEK